MNIDPTQETFYPVHLAALLGDATLMRLLLQHGANVQQRSSLGRSAWEMAVQKNVARLTGMKDVEHKLADHGLAIPAKLRLTWYLAQLFVAMCRRVASLLLLLRPGAPSSVLAPSSDARCP